MKLNEAESKGWSAQQIEDAKSVIYPLMLVRYKEAALSEQDLLAKEEIVQKAGLFTGKDAASVHQHTVAAQEHLVHRQKEKGAAAAAVASWLTAVCSSPPLSVLVRRTA